jgi:hypothetical protein
MQPNPYKLTSQVSLAPDPQLSSMLEKFKQVGDAVSFSVVFNEVQRRKEVRDAAQSKMMGGPKPQVADQLIQESKMAQMPAQPQGMGMGMPQGMPPGGGMPPQGMPPQGMPPQGMPPQGMPQGGPPQGLPEQAGIGQLPAPNMQNMAGGGIVSFAGDDDSFVLPNYYPDEGITSYAEQGGDVTAPITPMGMEEGEDEEDPYPRMDIRDAVGSYSADMDKLLAEQQANYDKYKAERDKFGPAYANAEAREKEMSQQYEDEARTQRGLPWLAAGAAMMQSSGKGISGLADAIGAGLPAYTAGRDKLAGLRDKQRDFMQTVAEARRAEARGDTDKLYALQQSMAAQKANIAGIKANLGLEQDKTRATLAASMAEGRKDPGLDKLASRYIEQADAYEAAASDPKNAARKTEYMAAARQYRTKGNELIDRIKNNQFTLSTQTSTYMQEIQGKIRQALALLNDPATEARGMEQLDTLGAGYPGGGVSGEYLLELIRSSRGGSSGSTGGVSGSGAGVVHQYDNLNSEEDEE